MKHLILGSSGQIGTALRNYLKSKNETVIEFDIKRSIDEDLRILSDNLDHAMQACDFVHFLAFDVGGAKYLDANQEKFTFIRNNMMIMSNVFETLRFYNKPFIFASSPNYPNNSYGMLKGLGEKSTYDLGGIVTRFWNVYDKEPVNEQSHVITDFIHMARTNGEIKMRTNGFESRQFLYGEDCAEALYIISQQYKNLEKLQNITSFKWYKIHEVARLVADEFPGTKIIFGENFDGQNDAKIEPRKTDIIRFWQPKTTLKDGIQKIL